MSLLQRALSSNYEAEPVLRDIEQALYKNMCNLSRTVLKEDAEHRRRTERREQLFEHVRGLLGDHESFMLEMEEIENFDNMEEKYLVYLQVFLDCVALLKTGGSE